jgi:hypothetical protein
MKCKYCEGELVPYFNTLVLYCPKCFESAKADIQTQLNPKPKIVEWEHDLEAVQSISFIEMRELFNYRGKQGWQHYFTDDKWYYFKRLKQ